MNQSPQPVWWAAPLGEFGRGRPLALLFDFDGTLTPLAPVPSRAEFGAAGRHTLAALSALPRVEVGVFSSRPLADLRAAVRLSGLFYAGCGGNEIDLRGRRIEHPRADRFRAALEPAVTALQWVTRRHPGAWLEVKPVGATAHYRALSGRQAMAFRAEAAARLGACAAPARVRDVGGALDVAPADGWDKGVALQAVLDHLGTDPFPVYAGDADDDAEALAAADVWGGLGLGVGPQAPAGATRLDSPAELVGSLGGFGRALAAVVQVRQSGDRWPADAAGGAAAGLLLVEPVRESREAAAAALERCGWRVWAAGDAAAALTALAAGRGDIRVALVDVGLPGLGAARLLTEIAAADPGVVRCLTSRSLSPVVEATYRHVSDLPLFTKPLDFDGLTNRLRALMTRRRTRPLDPEP